MKRKCCGSVLPVVIACLLLLQITSHGQTVEESPFYDPDKYEVEQQDVLNQLKSGRLDLSKIGQKDGSEKAVSQALELNGAFDAGHPEIVNRSWEHAVNAMPGASAKGSTHTEYFAGVKITTASGIITGDVYLVSDEYILETNGGKWTYKNLLVACYDVEGRPLNGIQYVNRKSGFLGSAARLAVLPATSAAGSFTSKGIAPLPPSFQLYPNPAQHQVTFQYSLPEQGIVQVEIYNLQGQLMERPIAKNMKPGQYAQAFTFSRLTAGFYMVKATLNGKVFVVPFTKM